MQEQYPQGPTTQGIKFNFNEGFSTFSAQSLKLMSFGYTYVASDLLWLRFLQNTIPYSMGKNEVSWVYINLDAISKLDPDFTPVYTHAAVFLGVINEDFLGAEQLLLKGIIKLPQSWQLHAYLAYLYQFELKEIPKAIEQYQAGAQLPKAPVILGLLAARLLTQVGQKQAGIHFLEQLIDNTTDPVLKKKFTKRLNELKMKQP